MENKGNMKRIIDFSLWTLKKHKALMIAYVSLLVIAMPFWEILSLFNENGELSGFGQRFGSVILTFLFVGTALFFACILSLTLFSYMHNKRAVDMFGSLPFSRRTLFFVRYMQCLVFILVPYLSIGTISVLALEHDNMLIAAHEIFIVSLIAIITNITLIGFVAICCSSVVDTVVTYLAFNILFPITMFIIKIMPTGIIPGMNYNVTIGGQFAQYSPLFSILSGNTVFKITFGGVYFDTDISDYYNTDFNFMCWILVTIVAIVAMHFLCKKRKYEMAQSSKTFRVTELIIKIISCVGIGLFAGVIISTTAKGNVKTQFIMFFVGAILGVLITNSVLQLIYHRGFVDFGKSLKECLVSLVLITGITITICSGFFGLANRMPDKADIESAQIFYNANAFVIDGKNVLAKSYADSDSIDLIMDIQKDIIKSAKKERFMGLYPVLGIDTTTILREEIYYSGLVITYTLKDGSKYERMYDVYNIHDKYSSKKVVKDLYTVSSDLPYFDAKDMIPNKYIERISVDDFTTMEDDGKYYYRSIDNNESDYKAVKELEKALEKDKDEILKIENNEKKKVEVCYEINISYRKEDEEYDGFEQNVWTNTKIDATCTNTIEVLKKYFLCEQFSF